MLSDLHVSAAENLTINDLTSLLKEQKQHQRDFVIPARNIEMTKSGIITFSAGETLEYNPNEVMHQHIANKLKIPITYYRKMLSEAPDLLSYNVNKWLDRTEKDEKYLIRTFNFGVDRNIGRALLSDSYKILDNFDILIAVLRVLQQSGMKVIIKEASITEKRMYIHIVAPDQEVQTESALRNYLRQKNVSKNYGISAGLVITNSEVGHGRFIIYPRLFIKICENGAVVEDPAFAKTHIGAKLDEGSVEWSERTKQKNIELMMYQAEDVIQHFLSKDYLSSKVQKLERAAQQTLEHPHDTLQGVVKELSKDVSFKDDSLNRLLNYFTGDGDTSAAGVFQALTREAQNLNADNRYELERRAFGMLPKIKSFDKPFKASNN